MWLGVALASASSLCCVGLVLMTVCVSCGLQNFTRFSSWFGNYSHGNKQQRLLAELSCAMAAGDTGATCSRNSVRRDYLPALRQVRGSGCVPAPCMHHVRSL